ncbi:putative inner centromere ARK-binding protein [Helianthus anomalus]
MTTLEKLFMQIFERKDSIIEQLQQQADLYTQQLASRLVIDGITPPPWLLSPNSSNPDGLEKEQIISKLLLRPPPDSIRYSIGGRSLYYPPVVPGGNINRQLSTEKCTETHAPNKAVDLSNEHMVTLECHKYDNVGILDHVPEQDDSAKSPQSEMDARITSIYAAPDASLARIQRSKSRQKARELRTAGKNTAKSRLNNENRTHISLSGESKSKKDFHHVIQDKCPSDMNKWNNISVAEEGNDEKGNDGTSHNKIGSSFDKEELDDDIIVEPTGESLQQSCRVNDVIEGANLPDVCLGSYASKKSITRKLQGTKSHNNRFSGRITRSRSSRLQTSGINQSSKPGTSVSRNPKGAGALSHSVGDSMQSNKLKDAAKNSCDINVETQAICSHEGLLKPVVSSYIDMNESLLGGKHQKSAEIEGNGPIDELVAMQPVNSGNNLDPITLRQSSNSCMNFIPKQLNFDEIDKGDLNEVFSSLSKKRKPDEMSGGDLNEVFSSLFKKRKPVEMSGKECYSSKEVAPSIDHESSCNVIEQQLPKQNDMSSGTETTRAHSYDNMDELAKGEMKNIDVDMNDNHPVMDDVEHDDIDVTCDVKLSLKEVDNKFDKEKHSGTSHSNEDQASSLNIQTEEDDLDHKDKESATAAGVYMPVSNIKSSLTSSLTKQGNNSFEDCFNKEVNEPEVDLEVGSIPKLSNMKLNSAKANTWPLNQQKDVEDQPNCFSDSRNFRVHIQRDGIRCDLETETPENGSNLLKGSASILSSEKIHLIQSDGMQSSEKRVHYEMNCDLLKGTQSLLETQAAEEIVTEVDDDTAEITDTLKQAESTCVVNLIKNVAADDSTYSLAADVVPTPSIINDDVAVTDNFEINLPEWGSSPIDDNTMVVSDKITPVYEGFIIDDETGNVNVGNNEGGIDFDTLEIPSTTIERASIIEQLCKSASMQTPLSQFSPSCTQHQVEGLYGFMADGILDHVDLGTSVSIDEDSRKNPQQQKFDCATPLYYQLKNHYSSPVGKLWERSASSSGSSEIQMSSNPDLTCFPIEEDPSDNEENENPDEMQDELQENISPDEENENPVTVSTEMKIERRENDDDVAVANHISMSSMKYADRYSSNSVVSMEVSVPRTRDKVKYKPKIPHGIKVSRYEEDSRNSSIATRASSRGNLSVNSKNKSGMRSGIPRLSQKEAKRNNIVSNIASFIPMVQQKQATAACTGKRDIKVKALEAAEAAKRREQEKENERKLKKEALKLERERIGKENAKEMELKLKKQEELKKKEAEIAARKRQREEEERKQLVKKRKLVAEAQKNQKLKNEKSRPGKLEPEKHVKNAAVAGNKKNNKNADESSFQKQDTGLKIDKSLATVVQQVTSVPENRDASNYCGEKDKATNVNEMSPVKVVPVKLTSQENSYDISPYQCSDDEDDEDEPSIKKFVPSWASKNRVAMVLPLQQKLNPELIFSVDSFCSMDEVLLPRRLQAQ